MPRRFRGRSLRIRTLPIKYNPSSQARRWHASQKRFRFLVCGLKSGKTYAGAFECLRQACKRPKQLVWAAAPTTRNLEEAHRQFMNLLFQVPEIVHINRQKPREVELTNGTLVQFHTLDRPDNLRGPNVDYCWMEEAAFAKAEAWDVIRGRVAATRGGVGATTTPNGRNWLWNELLIGGLPPHCPEGEFESDTHFVSRYPTWDFPWVDAEYIADEKRRLPKAKFDQEYGADFSFGADEVFRNVEECFDFVPPPKNVKERCVLGVDLGKHQDFSGVVGMEGGGRVLHVERWSGVDWIIQRARIVELSKKWNAVVVLDVSNVGSVIEEDLRRAGVRIHPCKMNDPRVKIDIINCLQLDFETKAIKLPSPAARWTTPDAKVLYDELKMYECSETDRGQVSYSAPKGMYDDLVVAFALANWGRSRGLAEVAATCDPLAGLEDEDEVVKMERPRVKRPNPLGRIFGRMGRLGLEPTREPFWR